MDQPDPAAPNDQGSDFRVYVHHYNMYYHLLRFTLCDSTLSIGFQL